MTRRISRSVGREEKRTKLNNWDVERHDYFRVCMLTYESHLGSYSKANWLRQTIKYAFYDQFSHNREQIYHKNSIVTYGCNKKDCQVSYYLLIVSLSSFYSSIYNREEFLCYFNIYRKKIGLD